MTAASRTAWYHDKFRNLRQSKDGVRRSMPSKCHVESTTPDVAYLVDVVDGNGVDLSWEPVVARFDLGDGYHRIVTETTDGCGRARFVTLPFEPVSVAFEAHGEIVGPIRQWPGQTLVIET